MKATRAVITLTERRWMPEHLKACHLCDTPLCVNYAHLFSGTQADNLADMTNKGRRRRSLSAAQLSIVKARLSRGDSYYSIAKDLNIPRGSVWKIGQGIYYAD